MANKKITDLQLISSITDTVNIPGDPGTQSYRMTALQFWEYVEAKIGNKRNALAGGTTAGSANAQTLTPAKPLTSYETGTAIIFKAGYTNSGATTLNVSGLGAKAVKTNLGQALTGSEITVGLTYLAIYDGTDFILAAAGTVSPKRTVRGNSSNSASAAVDNVTIPTLKQMLRIAPSFRGFPGYASGTFYVDYAFVVQAAITVTPTAGATYTHNAVVYTVTRVLAHGALNVVYAWGNAAPQSSGTLTKAGGTGDASIAFIEMHAPVALWVDMCGGGGGGRGSSGNNTAGAASGGGNTSFAGSIAYAGAGASAGISGLGTGGGISIAAPMIDVGSQNGDHGKQCPLYTGNTTVGYGGGAGGSGMYGGGGSGGHPNTTVSAGGGGWGGSAYGAGGGGAGGGGLGNSYGGGGGGGGGIVRGVILNPSAAGYAYEAGGGGGGSAGVGSLTASGGAGVVGVIFLQMDYQ